jgi:adenylate cyclase
MLKKLKSPSLIITFLILFAGIYANSKAVFPFLDIIELKTIDFRFKARGEKVPGSSIVLAVVDEKSLKAEGKWIWPRKKIAGLIDRLSDAGARVIAFDIVFSEPDDQGIELLQDVNRTAKNLNIDNPKFNNYLSQLIIQSDNDHLLAEAIARSKAKVVLGTYLYLKEKEAAHMDADTIKRHAENMQSATFQSVQYISENAFANAPFLDVSAPESNISVIDRATNYSGYFNMLSDKDGVIRWVPGVFRFRDNLYAHLSIKALSAYTDKPLSISVGELGVEALQIGDLQVPTDELGRVMINYRGGQKSFPHISVTDILNDRFSPNTFKDKLVIVGVTAIGVYDLRVTPFDTDFPGVEINANLMDSIISRDFLYQPAHAQIYNIIAMILLGGYLGWLLPKVKVIPGAITALVFLTGYVLLCLFFFSTSGIVLNIVYPVITTLIIYISLSVYRYFVEEGKKRFIRNAFSTYLAPTVVNQLIESPETLVLGGEERQITSFFSDVAGFTSISEKLSPHELVELLNEFLTEMSDIILVHNGMVDKYEGDAIIAMFGAPNDLENHAEVACAASIDMQKRLDVLRKKWEAEKNLTIRMRIGLCSGPAVVGNMGSKNRMDYTMMGDTVNTAARLEGVNKIYGTYTVISETTYEDAKESIVARELDAINVVGKAIPVKIFELIGYKSQISKTMIQTITFYEKGLEAYRQCQWNHACEYFNHALEITPGDPPSLTMIKRCREYEANPPDSCWNGAYIMKTK